MTLHQTLRDVTDRIRERSHGTRSAYLAQMRSAATEGPQRGHISCGNLAHAAAASAPDEKKKLAGDVSPNIGIVTSFNDMLSAHQPMQDYPQIIKEAVAALGGTAQVAGGVPAMCDGVTQGQAGMDLSLFSRDVIAMATAVSLSHNVFDGALMLGVCDKIVPGLFIGAARFGHLPVAFVPAGPMPSGLPNEEKSKVRQLYAEGRVGRDALLDAETKSYHSAGTCTFYGTANSNQMMMEIMGLHLPGSAFINPGTPLRDEMTKATAERIATTTGLGDDYTPFYDVITEEAIVNAIIGLHATGGSTNHLIHLVAMAASAGVQINWTDFADLSAIIPLLCRIYPNGFADVNQFHNAGGIGFVIRELLDAGLLHEDVTTITGKSLRAYTQEPLLSDGELTWRAAPAESGDPNVLRTVAEPASATGGLRVLDGNVGRAVIKVSAVREERQTIRAPAIVFRTQNALLDAFKAGELERDFIAVVPYQGPKANGMPELHKLTPSLTVLQNRGFKVALVTDGRMSGASGVVPAAIHLTPEALAGGLIGKIRDGDMVELDAKAGVLRVEVSDDDLRARPDVDHPLEGNHYGSGRELFAGMRHLVGGAEEGAMVFSLTEKNE